MLYRRLQKLHILLTCTQQLDKAKPDKKEAVGQHRFTSACLNDWLMVAMVTNLMLQAETAKTNADHTYQIITEVARKEVIASSLFYN